MKKFYSRSLLGICIVICCLFVFISCSEDIKELDYLSNNYEKSIGENIVINVSEIELLNVGCNNDVCEVNQNVIIAIKEGECIITLKYKEETKEIKVNVKSNININKYEYDMFLGDGFELESSDNLSYEVIGEGLTLSENKVYCNKEGNHVIKVYCGNETKDINVSVKNLIIKDRELSGYVGDELIIEIENTEGNTIEDIENIKFSSLSDNIEVNKNKVKCLEKGSGIVLVEYDGATIEVIINVTDKLELVIDSNQYTVEVNKEIILSPHLLVNNEKDDSAKFEYFYEGDYLKVDGNKVVGLKPGTAVVKITYNSLELNVTVNVEEGVNFEVNDMELYIGESKDLDINIIKGDSWDIKDIIVTPLENNVEYNNGKITGNVVGETIVKVKLGNMEKEFKVVVNRLQIKVLNESLDIDFLDKLTLEIEYPEFLNDELTYKVGKTSVLKVENNTIIPLSEGKTQIIISLKNNPDVKKVITVNVTVDPIKIIELLHQEEVLMKKEVSTYGSVVRYQSVMGSVSRYLFDELVIEENIISVTDNPYVGQKATPEILKELDETQKPRTGVLLEEIKYITYHDTGNNNAGADAKMHANYMVSSGSLQYRARSWHYTVDSGTIIHHVPDNEVAWQGDEYDAYAKSIGIETCVNFGSNLHLVWQRMGKLCAMLISKYGLDISSIKQHYDWNQKNCPQTLRRNNLYSYAISLVEGELLARMALKGYEIKFKSLNPEYLNDKGCIIKAPESPIKVGYEVTITSSKGYNQTTTLYSVLNTLA